MSRKRQNGSVLGKQRIYYDLQNTGVHDMQTVYDSFSGAPTNREGYNQGFGTVDGLYAFTTHTFTTAGNDISRDGPTLSEAQAAYGATAFLSYTYFNVVNGGTQLWVVPITGTYSITAAGSRGGTEKASYGFGRIVSGDISLTQGDVLAIIVGAQGRNRGGGGGSYVWYWNAAVSSSTPGTQNLIICGGGGGGGGGFPTASGQTSSTAPQSESAVSWFANQPTNVSTTNSPPTTGGGGERRDNTSNYWDATAGAGWNGPGPIQGSGNTPSAYWSTWGEANGTINSTIMGAQHPKSTVAPGRGGIAWWVSAGSTADGAGAGGFGGGGTQGGDANAAYGVGGGGGGYSGGAQGGNRASGGIAGDRSQGGGAGSYLTSSPYLSNKTWGSTNNAAGYVTITFNA